MIVWPDGKKQLLKNVKADTTLVLAWKNAGVNLVAADNPTFLFSDITGYSGLLYKHQENLYNDYTTQQLLPQKYSQTGPFITTGDINNDGTTDFFIGGAFNSSGKFFKQKAGPIFTSKNLTDSIKFEEDLDCILFDADKDGDNDLLVTCGGMHFEDTSVYYKPRIYFNDGKGSFKLQPYAIPE